MKASELVAKIEREGGSFSLEPDGKVRYTNVPPILLPRLVKNAELVKALIKERGASEAWERSGRNPNWWRR